MQISYRESVKSAEKRFIKEYTGQDRLKVLRDCDTLSAVIIGIAADEFIKHEGDMTISDCTGITVQSQELSDKMVIDHALEVMEEKYYEVFTQEQRREYEKDDTLLHKAVMKLVLNYILTAEGFCRSVQFRELDRRSVEVEARIKAASHIFYWGDK